MPRPVLFALLLLSLAWIATSEETGKSEDRVSRVCDQQPAVSVFDRMYNVHSNRFGSSQRECISVKGTSFTVTESGISNPSRRQPGGYPSIFKGCHWGACTSNSGLPVRVSELSSARSDWDTSLNPNGAYNAAYDLWFNSERFTNRQADSAELMIWLYSRGGVQPLGSRVGQVVIGDSTYAVWFGRKSNNRRGPANYIAYTELAGTGSASNLNIKEFIDDAVVRGYIDPSWYFISIQAGFEIWQGGEGLATNSFAATINNALGSAPLSVWWPRAGDTVSGLQPLKARLKGEPLEEYEMFWSVDGGALNRMHGSAAEFDHKQADVDFTEWTWRDAGDRYGPFLVTFTAKDGDGTIVRQKTIKLYVAKDRGVRADARTP